VPIAEKYIMVPEVQLENGKHAATVLLAKIIAVSATLHLIWRLLPGDS